MALSQAVFCLNTDLKPNTRYYLKYADQTKDEASEMMTYNRETKNSERPYWQTTTQKEMASLDTNFSLTFEKTEV